MINHSNQKNQNSQSFSGVFPVWKRWGETLSVLLDRFRAEQQLPADVKLTYAGRLDPAAEGVVLMLAGEARFKKEEYLRADKTYLLTILFGIKTDTADLLGIPEQKKEHVDLRKLGVVLERSVGSHILPYPVYSSRPVQGKPLFAYGRAGEQVVIPTKKVTVHTIELIGTETVAADTVLRKIEALTSTVLGDFRQAEIISAWQEFLDEGESYKTVTLRVQASSGTYMRSLAEAVAEKLGTVGCAYAIVRERVGKFKMDTLFNIKPLFDSCIFKA